MPLLPRHSLLPDLQRSRAVLVGFGAGRAAEMTHHLAEALTATTFRPLYTDVLVNPEDPNDVIEAVRLAAATAPTPPAPANTTAPRACTTCEAITTGRGPTRSTSRPATGGTSNPTRVPTVTVTPATPNGNPTTRVA